MSLEKLLQSCEDMDEAICVLCGFQIKEITVSEPLDPFDFDDDAETQYVWEKVDRPFYFAKSKFFWSRHEAIADCYQQHSLFPVLRNAIEDAGFVIDRHLDGYGDDPDTYYFWRLAGEKHDPRNNYGVMPGYIHGYLNEAEALVRCIVTNNVEVIL